MHDKIPLSHTHTGEREKEMSTWPEVDKSGSRLGEVLVKYPNLAGMLRKDPAMKSVIDRMSVLDVNLSVQKDGSYGAFLATIESEFRAIDPHIISSDVSKWLEDDGVMSDDNGDLSSNDVVRRLSIVIESLATQYKRYKVVEQNSQEGKQNSQEGKENGKEWSEVASRQNELMKKRLGEFYAIFGQGEEGKKKFEALDGYDTWKSQVEKDLARAHITPQSPGYEQQLQVNIFARYHKEIAVVAQLDPTQSSQLQSLVARSRQDLSDAVIRSSVASDIPRVAQQAIVNSSTTDRDAKYVRIGDTIYRGDEIYTIRGSSMEKSIRGESGIVVSLGTVAMPDAFSTIRRDRLLSQMRTMTGMAGFDGSARAIRAFCDRQEIELGEMWSRLSEVKSDLQKLRDMKRQLESGDMSDFEVMARVSECQDRISELEQKEKQAEQEMKRIAEILAEFVKISDEYERLADSDVSNASVYQEQIRDRDAKVRDNLAYVSSLGLDLLGQDGIDLLLEQINRDRQIRKEAPLELNTGFSMDDKRVLAQTLERLVGKEPPVFMKDEVPPQVRPDVSVSERLRSAGVLDGLNQFQKGKAEDLLKQETWVDSTM